MDVILLERIAKLGAMGDTVKVKDGFARNFLLPQGKALRANKSNMAVFEARREELEKRNAEMKLGAEDAASTVDGSSYVVIRSAGEAGQLYGSVSTRDIAALVAADGAAVTRNNIVLPNPIKTIGMHEIEVSLHADVSVTVTLNVARSEDEAERQARGEDVFAEEQDEAEEEAIAPEEVFEDETVAADASAELAEAEEAEEAADVAQAEWAASAEAATAEKAAAEAEAEDGAEAEASDDAEAEAEDGAEAEAGDDAGEASDEDAKS
ncbi:MAG: 50S ribosomal protein L9 [Alphaproteobacteria bacterium]|nr:50S ribosomal protein L9 [Alphaproteobacteria bacterium]